MASLDDLAPLVGTWRGRGEGEYPTIEPFSYTEELVVAHVPGRPILTWTSRTLDVEGNRRHAESGFLRLVVDTVELVVAHSFGIVEVAVGSIGDGDGGVALDLDSLTLAGTPTAKEVTSVSRRYEVGGDRLRYEIAMAAVGMGLTHHLRATLDRS